MITERQKRAISFIERELEIKFNGNTFEEAFEFIGNNLKHAQFCAEMDKEIGLIGVPVYQSEHDKARGKDYTALDKRDTISEIRFKSRLLHGGNPIDALIDLQESIAIGDE